MVPIDLPPCHPPCVCVSRPFGLNCVVNLNCVNSLAAPPPPSKKFKFICKFLKQFHNSINETITTVHTQDILCPI